MKKTSILILAVCLFSSCVQQDSKQQTQMQSEFKKTQEDLTAALDSIQKNGLLNGFAVAIVNEEGTLYENGFGYADVEAKKEYTAHSLQHIASVSKTLIGIALMKAQEEGKLHLDDPIQKHLSFDVFNPFYPKDNITIRHLATHTSGINDTDQYMDHAWIVLENQEGISTAYPEQRLNPWEKKVAMDVYLKAYLQEEGTYYQNDNYNNFKAGERYNYSNIGATLAAYIIEQATGIPFDDYTQRHILDPLGMDASGWSMEDVDASAHSLLYRNDNTVLPFYTAITYPDGMLISSGSDMAKYLSELVKGYIGEGTLLSAESYKEFFRPQLDAHHFAEGERNPDHPYDEDYNPALFIGHSALGYVGHSGGDAGVGTWLFIDKKTKTGRYIVKNTDSGNDNRKRELQYYAIWDKMNEYVAVLNEKSKERKTKASLIKN